MSKGPRGEKRPADAIGLAVMNGQIATGEIEIRATDQDGCGGAGQSGREEAPKA